MITSQEWTCLFGVVALVAIGPTAADAAEPSSIRGDNVRPAGEPKDPEALIREGNELRKQGRNEEALPLFQAAYAAARNPRTAGQLGLCEMSVGYWIDAEAHLAEALEFPNHPWVARNAARLREMLGKARQKIVEIDVTGSPPGAEVRANGRAVGTLPLAKPLRLAEGLLDIQVIAPGYRSELRKLSVKGGDRLPLVFQLQPDVAMVPVEGASVPRTVAPNGAPGISSAERQQEQGGTGQAPVPSVARADVRSERQSGWPAVLAVTASVAAIGFGAVELYLWQHAQNSFNDHVVPKPGSLGMHDCGEQDAMRGGPGCQGLYDEAVRSRTFAVVGLAAGAAFAVTGALLWPPARNSPTSEPKVSCAPNPGNRGVECRWRF
jgi:hypothetical protein